MYLNTKYTILSITVIVVVGVSLTCSLSIMQAVSPVKSMECDVCKIIALYLNKFVTYNGTEVSSERGRRREGEGERGGGGGRA